MEGRREDRAQVMLEEDFEAHHNRDPYFRTIEFHAHDFLELYLFLDGSVTYYIEDQVYDLCPGDLLIIPPGRMHRPVIANERAAYERMVLWVELDYIARIDSAAGELQAALRGIGANGYRVPLRGDDLIFAASLFRRIVKMERGGVFTSSAIRLYLKDAFEAYSLVEKEARGETAVIPQVIRYLTEHFREPLRLDDLAARFFISKSYLNRHFKAYTNATVYAYLMALRITHARRMLREGATAAEAGRECGFSDYSTFYKAFKAQTGITPQEFKARV
ncbi:MAG TPA: AraC family transcriptional regulator [Candidatus Ruminococcus gallistercoris]|jgi:AraC-like DNA-binding protein|nr:AraC family transcriptional regulator [Candidatus Ruminococcus gallistercoris]